MQVDWHYIIFGQANAFFTRMDFLARKTFSDNDGLADEAVDYALERIQRANYAKLHSYEARKNATPETFLNTVFKNLMKDFANHKFGKCQPPVWVKRLGNMWVELYKNLCCYHKSIDELSDFMKKYKKRREDLERDAAAIKHKIPHCGAARRLYATAESDTPIHMGKTASHEQQQHLATIAEIELALDLLMSADNKKIEFNSSIYSLIQATDIEDEAIIILRLFYKEGVSLSDISKVLKQPYHSVRRKKERAEKVIITSLSRYV
ncbi:MAG: hypothetical protein ABJH06_13900 [Paraglaciecola sp.]|uniref:hypothetical protein n=1 Tax=Paraglaciecola sp. TaxID=1920173 RepID=UPI0032980570